jgi:MoxR-like ATPase
MNEDRPHSPGPDEDHSGPAGRTDAPAPPASAPLDVAAVSALCQKVLDEIDRAVVGKRRPLTLVLAAVLAGGHVLLEDLPGLGKTLAARSLARTLGLTFTRAQFTPDMLPADLTGSFVYDQRSGEFVLRRGPVFTGLLLADEINRTPPKTQSALLEAMQEHQVTVEGTTFALSEPFHVLATSNPIEYEGTFPLPEAQLDRFLLRVSFGYPTVEQEWEVLSRRLERQQEDVTLMPVTDAQGLLAMRRTVETVTVDASIGRYCVALATATRAHQHVLVGASPRGSLALVMAARAVAVISGRDYVTPEDVKAVALPALAHRLTIRPELWMTDVTPEAVVGQVLGQVPTPAAVEPEVEADVEADVVPAARQ